jgi:hypothetical protein
MNIAAAHGGSDLISWREFLIQQIEVMQTSLAGVVHQLSDDPELLAETMIGEAQLQEPSVIEAIDYFIENDRWPDWSSDTHAEQMVYLLYRLLNAKFHLDTVLVEEELRRDVQTRVDAMTPGQILRWLLIDGWNITGPAYLERFAAAYRKRSWGRGAAPLFCRLGLGLGCEESAASYDKIG